MHVQNLMNSLRDIRIFLGLGPKESPSVVTPGKQTIVDNKYVTKGNEQTSIQDLIFV